MSERFFLYKFLKLSCWQNGSVSQSVMIVDQMKSFFVGVTSSKACNFLNTYEDMLKIINEQKIFSLNVVVLFAVGEWTAGRESRHRSFAIRGGGHGGGQVWCIESYHRGCRQHSSGYHCASGYPLLHRHVSQL